MGHVAFKVTLYDVTQDGNVDILGHGYDSEREFYIVNSDVLKDHEYILNIAFQGDLNDDLAGFYRSSYMVDSETKYIATTQMEATDARQSDLVWLFYSQKLAIFGIKWRYFLAIFNKL